MKTIRVPLKKGEKLRLSKPEDISLIVRDNRKAKGFFKVKMKDGSTINDDEIVSLARKQKELEAEKRQLKGLTRRELSAVLHAVEKHDEKRRKKQDEKRKDVSKPKKELHKEELPRQDTELPEFLHKDKNLVILTTDYNRLSKLSHDDLFNELKRDNPFLTEKTKITLKPLGEK